MEKPKKKPFYKRVWFWTLAVVVLIIIGVSASSGGGNNSTNANTSDAASQEDKPIEGWDYKKAYAKIKTGMTKSEVQKAIDKKPESCTETQDPTFGKTELCSYGNVFTDKGAITVTYHQGKVASKGKTSY